MLKMKALPLRLVHALDACAPRTTHGRSSHLNSDPHVAAINITALAQPFEKGRQRPPIARSKIGVKKSDHRHRRLLRPRRERPRTAAPLSSVMKSRRFIFAVTRSPRRRAAVSMSGTQFPTSLQF